jgi:hypothetical protein
MKTVLAILFLLAGICFAQYQNGMDAIKMGAYGGKVLTSREEKRMEKEIDDAILKLRKLKRYTTTRGLDYTDIAVFSWYQFSGGGSVGRYKLDKQMFDQVRRSWFTDVTIKSNTAFSPNVNFDSSVVGYSLFVGWGDEKYIREHKNDKPDSIIFYTTLDSTNIALPHFLGKKEREEMELTQKKQREEHKKEIARRTFRVVKFIDKNHVLIDRAPDFEIEELQATFKPKDYIEGLCNCTFGNY